MSTSKNDSKNKLNAALPIIITDDPKLRDACDMVVVLILNRGNGSIYLSKLVRRMQVNGWLRDNHKNYPEKLYRICLASMAPIGEAMPAIAEEIQATLDSEDAERAKFKNFDLSKMPPSGNA